MLEDIKGIGPKTIISLNRLNIYSVNDLLEYYPYRYNFYKVISIEEIKDDNIYVINGNIVSQPKVYYIKRNFNRLNFQVISGNKLINVTIFNRAFIKPYLKLNNLITLIGKYNLKTNLFTANDLKLIPIINETIEPVYHLSQDIKKANFNKLMQKVLNSNFISKNYIPEKYLSEYHFINKNMALKEIHNPSSSLNYKQAKLLLTYEELFNFMLKINYLKIKQSKLHKAIIKNFDNQKVTDFISSLPFTLTIDQVNTIEDIKKDFNSVKRMNRLILGDVGSGKTIVSFIALYINYLSGYQGVLMAPTEILAQQHYNNMLKTFSKEKLNISLLTASTTKKERNEILAKIKTNEIDILIGTHSLLNDDLFYHNLGLVITDEQHRFGVNQRKLLQKKGSEVDVLYMSATPIPRTLALTIYGDMDISQIKTKPSNRKEIKTKLYKNSQIKEVLNEMLMEIKQNHQIYVIAPLIEDENDTGMENVNALAEKMNTAFNGLVPIKVLHGKLKAKEKEQIMNDFKANKVKILISTTVIEVGVDVANATMMVIFNAERFGLATLHQLRGRVGRNDLESKCLLISDQEKERLKVLEESNDGFYISEKDFELRGSGDLFGIKQSGEMTFKLANLKNDYKILLQCKHDSEEFLHENINNLESYPNQKEVIDSISFID
jgi:ATP-dependent DNA helicase RecG